MLIFFLSLACGPKKEVQTPVEMPEEVAVSEEVAEPEVPEPPPHQHSRAMSISKLH